jgi:hypothetical protein
MLVHIMVKKAKLQKTFRGAKRVEKSKRNEMEFMKNLEKP